MSGITVAILMKISQGQPALLFKLEYLTIGAWYEYSSNFKRVILYVYSTSVGSNINVKKPRVLLIL